jgi:hypothetical protein
MRKPRIGAALTAVVAAVGATMLASAPAQAATGEIHAAYIEYAFQNWDYDGSKHDNPVSIIFVSNSSNMVSRVYSQVGSVGLTGSGDTMTLSGIGGSRPGVNPTDPWTSHSAGRKGAFGCWGQCGSKTDIHLRTYGPDGQAGTQVYQGSYGYRPYYLIATIHFDVDEHGANPSFGYQDTARSLLVNKLVAAHKWTVLTSVGTQNSCSGWVDSTHYCNHNGTAWLVSIDG